MTFYKEINRLGWFDRGIANVCTGIVTLVTYGHYGCDLNVAAARKTAWKKVRGKRKIVPRW